MFLIDYVTPEKADGDVGMIYSQFPPEVGVPAPVQLYSASEDYLLKQMGVLKGYMDNEAYTPALLTALRFVGASTACFGFCTDFNRSLLGKMGLKTAEIDALRTDPSQGFEPKEATLIAFVSKAITAPDKVVSADIDTVRDRGWTDEQIFECTAYAAQMNTLGTVYRAFARK